MPQPALFVVKATIAPRGGGHGSAGGLLAMRRDVPVVLDVGVHRGSEEALRAFAASDTLKAMTRDYEARFGGAEGRVRLTYRQVFP